MTDLNDNYNDNTMLNDWWPIVKNNFAKVEEELNKQITKDKLAPDVIEYITDESDKRVHFDVVYPPSAAGDVEVVGIGDIYVARGAAVKTLRAIWVCRDYTEKNGKRFASEWVKVWPMPTASDKNVGGIKLLTDGGGKNISGLVVEDDGYPSIDSDTDGRTHVNTSPEYGITRDGEGRVVINPATAGEVAAGTESYKPVTPKTLKSVLDGKADKQTSNGGFAGGDASFSGDDTSGVVIGHYATNGGAGGAAVGSEANVTGNGAAVGYHASAKGGGAIGASATADNGFAGGMNASAGYGCAAGRNAVTKNGVAVGSDAKTQDSKGRAINAIQLGTGTNTKEKTVQVYDYTLMGADGKIPPERLLNITASGKCGDQVFWFLCDDGQLVIYGSGAMYDFSVDGAPWKNSKDNIYAVKICDGVTNIGARAFEDCAVYSVSIPNSVTTIGTQAFMNTQLYSINIPYGVTEIGDSAFYGCGMEFINMPVSVVDIDVNAFRCLGPPEVFYPDVCSADEIHCRIDHGNDSFNAAEKHYGMAYLEDIGVAVPTRYSAASNYTTTPQWIGTWIDGRPIYRQVFQGVFEEIDIEDISQYGGKDSSGLSLCPTAPEASIALSVKTIYHIDASSPSTVDDIPAVYSDYSYSVVSPVFTSAELAAKLTAGVSGYTTIIEYVGKE